MITYIGPFDLALMIALCKREAGMHMNKNNVDESEVPFSNEAGEVRYMQFLNVAGNWVFVRIRG